MTDKKAALWLLKAAGKYRGYIGALLLLQTAVSGGAVCYALVMKKMIDHAVKHMNCSPFVRQYGIIEIYHSRDLTKGEHF